MDMITGFADALGSALASAVFYSVTLFGVEVQLIVL